MEPKEHPRLSDSGEITSKISEVPRTVFFDTNFFRALLKNDFQSNLENKNSDLRVALQLPFRPWRTPFSFMEWIGMKSKSVPMPTPFEPASVTGTDGDPQGRLGQITKLEAAGILVAPSNADAAELALACLKLAG